MAEPQIVHTIRTKRDQIERRIPPASPIILTLQTKIAEVERYIADMERRVANARRDLGHLQATVHLLNQGSLDAGPAYMGLRRVFKRREITETPWRPLLPSERGTAFARSDLRLTPIASCDGHSADHEQKHAPRERSQSHLTETPNDRRCPVLSRRSYRTEFGTKLPQPVLYGENVRTKLEASGKTFP